MTITVYDLEKTVNSGLTTKIKSSVINYNQLCIQLSMHNLYSTILYLKTNEKCKFKQLIDITAIDYPEKENRFKIVYFLLSHENNLRVIVYSDISENTEVQSIVKIFPSANWMEREIFDMYGIHFKEHPDLRRILTDYGFEGHPLRKDFPLTGHKEVRYSEDKKKVISETVKLDQEYRKFEFDSPWDGTKYVTENKKTEDK